MALATGAALAGCGSSDDNQGGPGAQNKPPPTPTFGSDGGTDGGDDPFAHGPTTSLTGQSQGSGVSAGDVKALDTAASGSASTKIVYPLAGAVFPTNFGAVVVQVPTTSAQQTRARVDLNAGSSLDYHYYAVCDANPKGTGLCLITLPASITSEFADASAEADITMRVVLASPDGSSSAVSQPITMAWSITKLTGGLYFWTTLQNGGGGASTGIARYNFSGDASKADIVYTDKTSPASHVDPTLRCIGCHAITHDGSKMALSIGGSGPSDFVLVDVASMSQIALKNSGPNGFATMTTFSHDGSRMVNMYRGDFTLRGVDSSLATQGPVLATAVSEKRTDPFWSVDGKLFAFSTWLPGQNGASDALYGDVRTGAQIWIAKSDTQTVEDSATLLVPRAPGKTSYNPAISDDSALVVFNQSSCSGPRSSTGYGDDPCDGYADISARLWLIGSSGGAPVSLDAANGPDNSMNSWPRWSPDHGTFRGKRIYWVAYSSERPYGLLLNQGGDVLKPQLWFAAIAVDSAKPLTSDPSFAPVWLPGQNGTDALLRGNHVPQWVTKAVQIVK